MYFYLDCTSIIGKIEGVGYWICLAEADNCGEIELTYVKKELLTKDILDMHMIGNEGVLTYINQTSRGQSGGAVIQEITSGEENLVGIHVSGYFRQWT